jgi:hypothetical protein
MNLSKLYQVDHIYKLLVWNYFLKLGLRDAMHNH